MLRPRGDLGGDVDLVQLALQHLAGAVDVLLALGAALVDHRLDLGVLGRVEGLEGEVLELPLDRVDAEAMRERRVDLEVSRAFWSCFCLPRYSIVRMLWSRSASLMRITRWSSAIATIIFR